MSKILNATMMLVTLSIAACSSTNSSVNNSSKSIDGLSYYMPKKDFIVTVSIGSNSEITNVTFGTTPAYADLSKQYVMKYNRNFIFKNSLKIGVDSKGLLTNAIAQTENTIPEAIGELKNIVVQGFIESDEKECKQEGDHLFIIPDPIPENKTFCGLAVKVEKLISKDVLVPKDTTKKSGSGIYYRQNEPYKITAEGDFNKAGIEFSPSKSSVRFLPIAKSLFSDTKTDFGFEDGIPKKYEQETEGELVALLTVPAQILNAYTLSAGAVFSNFSKLDSDKANSTSRKLELKLLKAKQDACLAAIASEDKDLKTLYCDFSGG